MGRLSGPSNGHVKEVNSMCQGKLWDIQTSLQLISQSIMNPFCSRNCKAFPDFARTGISIIIWKSSSICQRYGTTLSHCQQFSGGKKGRKAARCSTRSRINYVLDPKTPDVSNLCFEEEKHKTIIIWKKKKPISKITKRILLARY